MSDPACYGDPRFTTTNAADIADARTICRTCRDRVCRPILAELLADTTARDNLEGVWDGRYYSPATTGRKRVAA